MTAKNTNSAKLNLSNEYLTLVQNTPAPPNKTYQYGTAGFREKAADLDSVFVRVSLVAALRSLVTNKAVAVMVTASHNPVEDNGVKIIDPDGGMMEMAWESYASELANAKNAVDDFKRSVEKICNVCGVRLENGVKVEPNGVVIVGRDTRPHSLRLLELLKKGLEMLGVQLVDLGAVTTPQVHFAVQMFNESFQENYLALRGNESEVNKQRQYGVNKYYEVLSKAFCDVVCCGNKLRKLMNSSTEEVTENKSSKLIVDAAFGVGGIHFGKLVERINRKLMDNGFGDCQLHLTLINTASDSEMKNEAVSKQLNNQVGAEYVQVNRSPSKNIPTNDKSLSNEESEIRYASFDGDADRIVYFNPENAVNFVLLDGDKIACLFATFIIDHAKHLPKFILTDLSACIVQTAYANGASTKYIYDNLVTSAEKAGINFKQYVTKTGVKHLHKVAHEHDIGIYFEANGHGTVLFSEKFRSKLSKAKTSKLTDLELQNVELLRALTSLINQATGDAMSDCLAIEAILRVNGMLGSPFCDMDSWDKMYIELPRSLTKAKVPDRSQIITNDNETRVLRPIELQSAIDSVVMRYKDSECARAFVRPSGTEDVVRLYVEAKTPEIVEEISRSISESISILLNN